MMLTDHQLSAFERNGYITVPDLFSLQEVDVLRLASGEVLKLDRPELGPRAP